MGDDPRKMKREGEKKTCFNIMAKKNKDGNTVERRKKSVSESGSLLSEDKALSHSRRCKADHTITQ